MPAAGLIVWCGLKIAAGAKKKSQACREISAEQNEKAALEQCGLLKAAAEKHGFPYFFNFFASNFRNCSIAVSPANTRLGR